MANIEVIKWDGVADKAIIAKALLSYIREEDKELARKTSYGDLGKKLAKEYGLRYNSGNSSGYWIFGEPNKVKVETGHNRYILTWNKAAKLIHEQINQGGEIMTQLEEMDLSVRSFNCLRRAGISTVEALTDMTREQFRSTLGLGSNCMDETEARMKELGLSFREETTVNKQYMSNNAQYAFTVHAQIMLGAQMVENGLYQMAKGFKIMRDEKLYKEMGYKSFEEYCEVETGIKRAMVYRYIAVLEKAPADLSTRLDKLGVRKIELLASLTDEQRTEVVQTTDLENTTVKELQEKIRELTGERDRERELKEDYRREMSCYADREQELNGTIARLEREIKELEQRPVELQAVDFKDTEEYRQMVERLRSRKAEMLKACEERNELRKKADELQKQLNNGDGKKRYVLTMTERQMNKFLKVVQEYLSDEFYKIVSEAKEV